MKVVVLLTLLITLHLVLGSGSKSNKGGEFNFHQTGYKLVHHIAETVSVNETYMRFAKFVCYPYNRTTRALNLTLATNQNARDIKVAAQVYKFLSNEYRYFPITLEVDYWQAIQRDYFDFGSVRNCGNFPVNGSFIKGKTYHFCKWVPDDTKFPPYLPPGDYKLELGIKFGPATAFVVAWRGSVVENRSW